MASRTFSLRGEYVSGWRSASENWDDDIVANQKDDLPTIEEMCRGTFNIRLIEPAEYTPADIPQIRARKGGSCISRLAKVTQINGSPIEAFIYDGGWPPNTIELIARVNISQTLGLSLEDSVTVVIQEDTESE